jgi:hypothetical protein
MRDTDQPQPTPTLGKKIETPPMPKPHKKIAEGVYQKPDGTFETRKPENEIANMPIWHFFYNAQRKKP